MTPEAQRIAIAEACGWHHIENANSIVLGGVWVGYPSRKEIIGKKQSLPNYLHDLNAMAEVERTLINGKYPMDHCGYRNHLRRIVNQDNSFDSVFATAAQRAEAFLRTLNLWLEEPTK